MRDHFATLSLPDLRDLYGKTMDDLRIASRDGRCASAPLLAEVLRRNLVNIRTEIDSRARELAEGL